jgi:hypothetical protein
MRAGSRALMQGKANICKELTRAGKDALEIPLQISFKALLQTFEKSTNAINS